MATILEKVLRLSNAMHHEVVRDLVPMGEDQEAFPRVRLVKHVALVLNPADFHQLWQETFPSQAHKPLVEILERNPYLIVGNALVFHSVTVERLP
jgi:hypothetical protein